MNVPYFGRILAALLVAFGNLPDADAQLLRTDTHGELLYSTHCVSCHLAQDNWRDKKVATDWIILQAEVRRWQKRSMLDWNDDDAAAVAKYLNNFILYCDYPALN